MEEHPKGKEVRKHRIAKVLSILGTVLLVIGVLFGLSLPIAAIVDSSSFGRFDWTLRLQMLVSFTWIFVAHIAAGTICLGVSKSIQILEEIRAGA